MCVPYGGECVDCIVFLFISIKNKYQGFCNQFSAFLTAVITDGVMNCSQFMMPVCSRYFILECAREILSKIHNLDDDVFLIALRMRSCHLAVTRCPKNGSLSSTNTRNVSLSDVSFLFRNLFNNIDISVHSFLGHLNVLPSQILPAIFVERKVLMGAGSFQGSLVRSIYTLAWYMLYLSIHH